MSVLCIHCQICEMIVGILSVDLKYFLSIMLIGIPVWHSTVIYSSGED